MKHSTKFQQSVADAKKRIREITVDEVMARIDSQATFHLVDVREDSEWAAGHLPHAIHLGKGIIERDIEKTIPETSAEIVLYCGGGYRSALAADSLQKMGYQNVWSMQGGFKQWTIIGFPIKKNSP
jgi:rhodanese-related sulfurtransferase